MTLLVVPILVPFFTALVLALLRGWPRLEKTLALLSILGVAGFAFWLLFQVDATGIRSVVIGGWDAPWGIALVADRLACIMLCLSTGVGSVVLAYSLFTVTPTQQRYFFFPLFHIMLAGVNWSFITGDLFNLFVAFEVMLAGSYGMMIVGASRDQVRQSLTYVALNVVASALFVSGIALIYATTGALNFAELAHRTQELTGDRAAMVTAASLFLLVVFATKTAAWPLFFWLPDAYPAVPPGINGYFAGLLTKVGVYALLRLFTMVFNQPGNELALDILLVLSGFTMLLGVLGAVCQWDIRRILSWHIISQVGYMVMGIGLAGNADPRIVDIAIVGTIFYVVHHIVVKSSLFLIGGAAERVSGTQKIAQMGGVVELAPGLAGFFLIAALSLAGMPPFSGFLSKFVLIRAGLAGGNYIVVTIAIVTGFLTLFSMTKIWSYAFWRKRTHDEPRGRYRGMMVPTAVLVIFTIVMGVWAQPFMRLAGDTAQGLRDPAAYIEAVLPGRGQPSLAMTDAAHDRASQPATEVTP